MASALWTVAAISNGLMLLLPGAVTRHWRIDLAMCAAIAAWAVACLLIPPQRAGVVVFHTPALLAVPMIAIAIASTGGAHSKMAFEYFYVVSYCAYFYTYNQALVYAGLAGGWPPAFLSSTTTTPCARASSCSCSSPCRPTCCSA